MRAADEAEVGEIASPLSASSSPFSVENRSVSAESGEFFTATSRLRCFFSSVMNVIICLIDEYLFDRICDLFELTIRFA